jgi:predicted nucleotidyltransferase component of viral defense system
MIDNNFLPENTKKIFDLIAKEKFFQDYVLVGGTALSLQIQHRLSEDLDFIYDAETIPITKIKRFINSKFKNNYRILKEDGDYQIDFLISNVKLTFFSTGAVLVPFNVKDYSFKYKNLNIANLNIIAVLKMGTISNRNTIRDYYDLYYIAKHILPLKEIYELTKSKLPNLSQIVYTESIIYVDDINQNSVDNMLNPKEIVTKNDIAKFFEKEIIKIKQDKFF